MITKVEMFCPICGNKNKVIISIEDRYELHTKGIDVANCNEEFGGCGKDFVFDWELNPTIITYKPVEEDEK